MAIDHNCCWSEVAIVGYGGGGCCYLGLDSLSLIRSKILL